MTGSKPAIASDSKRVDAHEITAAEGEEVFFGRAGLYEGDRLVRRGRPRAEHPKVAISIRLSEEVLAAFRATGPGWQSRIDAALKEWLTEHPERAAPGGAARE